MIDLISGVPLEVQPDQNKSWLVFKIDPWGARIPDNSNWQSLIDLDFLLITGFLGPLSRRIHPMNFAPRQDPHCPGGCGHGLCGHMTVEMPGLARFFRDEVIDVGEGCSL